MSTNFPTSLDSYSTKVDGSDYPQAAHVNNLQDAVVALETKVGIDSSAVSTTLDYLIKNTSGGHRHDGTTSRRVLVTDLGLSTLTANQYVRVNSGGTALEGSSLTIPSGDLVGTSATQTLTNKTITQPTLTLKQGTSVTPTAEGDIQWDTDDNRLVIGDGASQKIFLDRSAMFDVIYPVGSLYFNATNSNNPGTLLGFGTWTSFGAGKVIVGYNVSDTDFDTAEETGGAKTATLTTTELPSHTHTFTTSSDGAHTHTINADGGTDNSSGPYARFEGGFTGTITSNSNGAHTHTGTTASSGSGSAFSIMNPYIVVYIWKRTA